MLATTYKGKHVWWTVLKTSGHDNTVAIDCSFASKPSQLPNLYFPRLIFSKLIPMEWNYTYEKYMTMQELYEAHYR